MNAEQRTPEEHYFFWILLTLIELGGREEMCVVLERVERRMRDQLTRYDREILPTTGQPRWRNAACWARQWMKEQGLLRADSPHGVWEITDKGRDYAKDFVKKLLRLLNEGDAA